MPTPQKPYTRSQAKSYDKTTDCIICLGNDPNNLSHVRAFSTHERIYCLAQTDHELFVRLQGAFDSVAGDVLYHTTCCRERERVLNSYDKEKTTKSKPAYERSLEQLRQEINSQIFRGQAVLISDCWERF